MSDYRDAAIPFYGAQDRAMFEIERSSMDRDGMITRHLDAWLPREAVLDVGAGDGFTAERLSCAGRRVFAVEPAAGMVERSRHLRWTRALAQQLPFRGGAFAGAYATFAYFFPSIGCGAEGLAEVERVLESGAAFHFVDSAGGDEFNGLTNREDVNQGADISSPRDWWHERGFESTLIHTSFRFETLDDARTLLGFFFADRGREGARLEIGFDVVVYSQTTPFARP